MRILIITSQFPLAGEPNRGRPVLQTVHALSQLAQVRVLSPVAVYPRWARPRSYLYRAPEIDHAVAGCEVEYLRYPALPALTRPFNGHLCARAVEPRLKAFAPDVVLSYWLYPDAYGAMRAAHRARRPLVVGARGSDLRVRDPISRFLTKPVLQAAGRILVVSEDLGRIATQDYHADPSKVRVIPNGCDAEIFHPQDQAQARIALQVDAQARLILYVGRLVPEKGLRELLQAVAICATDDPRTRLVLVGAGPMRRELEASAAALPSGLVRLAGALPAAEVGQWMAAADVVTLPSYSEGYPNVLVEALACGRPVVATPVGGVAEIVDASTGVLVAVRDPQSLAEGLAQVLARQWDTAALAAKYSRSWHQVAEETLRACHEAFQGTA